MWFLMMHWIIMNLKKSLIKLKKQKKNVDWQKLIYETNEYTYSFKNFQTIKTFGRDIYEGKITIKEADEYQKDLLVEIMNFRKTKKKKKARKKTRKKKCSWKLLSFLGGKRKNCWHFWKRNIFHKI